MLEIQQLKQAKESNKESKTIKILISHAKIKEIKVSKLILAVIKKNWRVMFKKVFVY